ncbi:MAG: hypothetical protein H6Q90_2117 [Deltaproteobacteria bacterium]|nr:hypothetical protein [Deltaproteobacteria bacterium]
MMQRRSSKVRTSTIRLAQVAAAAMLLFAGTASAATTVVFDPGGYSGAYAAPTSGYVTGESSVTLAAGTYSASILGVGSISFSVDAPGNVTSLSPESATGIGNRLVFKNATAVIDPGAYTGTYTFLYGPAAPVASGPRDFVLVPGMPLVWSVSLPGIGYIRFNLDAQGNVVSTTPDSATGVNGTLLFRNTAVEIDPAGYTGAYTFLYGPAAPVASGPRSFVLVPGAALGWAVRLPALAAIGYVRFSLDGAGNVVSQSTDSATAIGNKLLFKNATIVADPDGYTGTYTVGPVGSLSGISTVVLVPGAALSEALVIPGQPYATFIVYDPCQLSASSFVIAGHTFTLTCQTEPPPPPPDTTPPLAAIAVLPPYSATTTVAVSGTVTDSTAVASAMFFVNGVPASGPLAIGTGGAVGATVTLAEGMNTIVLRATDGAGNVGAASSLIVRDTVSPAVTIVSPSAEQAVSSGALGVTLLVTDQTATTITIGDQSFAVPSGTGMVSAVVTLPAPGANTVELTATDAAGNVATASTIVLLDPTAPIMSIDVDDGVRLGEQPGDQLLATVHLDALSATTVVTSTGETYSLPRGGGVVQIAMPLQPGTNVFTFTATNETGASAMLSRTVVYDTLPPTGSFMGPEPGVAVRGTFDATVDFTDDVTGVSSVSFRMDAGLVVEAEPTGGAGWKAALDTSALLDGAHTLEAVVVDGVGNSATLTQAFTVDNTAPVVVIASPAADAYLRSMITITASADDATSGVASLSITVNGHSLATCLASPCSVTFDTTTLPDGPFTIAADARDVAGNVAPSIQIAPIADNSVPANFLTGPLDGAAAAGSFDLAVHVTDSNFASVECFVGGVSLGISSSPMFSTTVSLASIIDGALSVSCIARDLAGGSATESATVTVRNWTEQIYPHHLNLNDGKGRVTMSVRGPNVALLLPVGSRALALSIPGAAPIPVLVGHGHGHEDDHDCDDRRQGHLDLKFERRAVVAAVRAALATGTIVKGKPFAVTLLSGDHVIGGDTMMVQRGHKDKQGHDH